MRTPPVLGDPTTLHLSSENASLSAPELLARAHGAARELADTGAPARIAVGPNTDALSRMCWFLGADLLGAATLITEPTWTAREHEAVLGDARPDRFVEAMPHPTSRPVTPRGDEETHFYLPTTSGSSGRPRVMTRDRRSWLRSFDAFEIGLTARDAVLVPGPLSSSLFLFAALHGLREGADVHLLERWSAAEAAEACRRSTVLHVVPPMLSALLAIWEHQPRLRERCVVDKVVCGGARVDAALRSRLHAVFPECELIEYYGAAEHSLIGIRRGDGPLNPVDGVEVDVREGERGLPPETAGQLWVRSELTFGGYLDEGTVRVPGAGFSSVGDRAVRHEDGSLTVLGRESSTISSGARAVSAEEVEAVVRDVAGVLDVVVSATPHPRLGSIVTAVLEIDPDEPPWLSALRSRVRQSLESAKRPRSWLATTDLPRTAAGKPARSLIAERLATGTLEARAWEAPERGALP
ncbi:long-chain acyl-CoA synthetase [Saccharopolyspora lacisalsi]|uniref:Long-chain acyl-CoA synthetase n=1 Tax=Halosaccharopolyspora lacisalsi TaxID=1000566 RepID=A0A839DWD8_9PSEU|nr:AMP-binding protein [Halosaccharopolyspora lacisalsi]MBA8823088.1 long-chain acyl-CoA synthetase [Halosaccharopolyspora lacisalsi]